MTRGDIYRVSFQAREPMPVGRKPMDRKSPCRSTSTWKWRQLVSKDFCSSIAASVITWNMKTFSRRQFMKLGKTKYIVDVEADENMPLPAFEFQVVDSGEVQDVP